MMRHGSSCGCPDCMDFHPDRFSNVGNPAPAEPKPGKHPIDRPCSACTDGDTEMEYHDHHPPFRKAETKAGTWCSKHSQYAYNCTECPEVAAPVSPEPARVNFMQHTGEGICFAHGPYKNADRSFGCPKWPNCMIDPQKPEYIAMGKSQVLGLTEGVSAKGDSHMSRWERTPEQREKISKAKKHYWRIKRAQLSIEGDCGDKECEVCYGDGGAKGDREALEEYLENEVREIIAIAMCGINAPLWETRQKVRLRLDAVLDHVRGTTKEKP